MTLSEVTRAELSEDVAGRCGRGLPPPVTSELPGHTLSVMLAAAPVPRRGLCWAPWVEHGPRVTDTFD